ncbi:MAG: hypothetical protein J5705_01640 [Bacteroidaceae bacterium]|nr:hypothetical protein [Bacteroidaceae bacterium]
MKHSSELLFILCLLLHVSCNKNPNILVDVKEVDFKNKSDIMLEGKIVDIEVLGAANMIIYDSLLMFTSHDPEGQLAIFSTNTLDHLGSFCPVGRAKNEMLNAFAATEQVINKDGHQYLIMIDAPNNYKEFDITESLKRGKTVIGDSKECLSMKYGEFMILGNDYDNRFEFEWNKFYGETDVTKVPSKYTVYKNGKGKEIKLFNSIMKNDVANKTAPYNGTLLKHHNKNFVIQSFQRMDYLLFMDFDSNILFAVHQKGSTSFNDTYVGNKSINPLNFTDGASTSKYVMYLYWQGDYTQKITEGKWFPELLVFDWEGNFVHGYKMDRCVVTIEYDEQHSLLYGITDNEDVVVYDMSNYL